MANFVKKYGHGLILLAFAALYFTIFFLLENRQVQNYNVIYTPMDDMIPFCEYFVIPYLLWFPFVLWGVMYFVFICEDRREYYQLAYNMMFGMVLFLAVSFFYPNIQELRPMIFPRDNICSDMVKFIYKVDTPTNILPSMHVYIAIAVCMAINTSDDFADHKIARGGFALLTVLIIASTVFLKQHSLVDVIAACAVAVLGYVMFYRIDIFAEKTLPLKEYPA